MIVTRLGGSPVSIDLPGRVAVVTGGASGIGEAVSRLCAERGVDLIDAPVSGGAAGDVDGVSGFEAWV